MKKTYQFGESENYQPGDIVVWGGVSPAILRIKSIITEDRCFCSTTPSTHNSLSYLHLRYATDNEVRFLGDLEIYHLAEGYRNKSTSK